MEVNPNGNWLRSENEFGWNLSADIVDYLCISEIWAGLQPEESIKIKNFEILV